MKKQEKVIEKKVEKKMKKRAKKVRGIRSPASANHVHLSPCAALYAKTLVDPFGTHGAGLPQDPAVPSLKTWAFARGELSTGTAGIGFIFGNPINGMLNTGNVVYTTDATYAGTTLTTAAAGVAGQVTNTPYTAANFANSTVGIRGRVVSAGIRIKYNGTELNRGGTVVALNHPGHNTLNTATFAQLDGMNVAKRYRPSNKWVEILYCPVLNDEYEFTANVPSTNFYMAAMIRAPSGTVATYDWEVFVNFEVNGQIVRGMTKTPIDPVGSAAVSNALQGTEMVRNEKEKHSEGFFSRVMNTLSQGFSYAVGGTAKELIGYGASEAGKIAAKTTMPYIEQQAAAMLAEASPYLEGAAAFML